MIGNSKVGLTRGHFIYHAYPYFPQACRRIHATAVALYQYSGGCNIGRAAWSSASSAEHVGAPTSQYSKQPLDSMMCHLYSAQACRRIHATAVVRKLKAAGLMEFSGTLRPSTEPLAPALIAPLLPPPVQLPPLNKPSPPLPLPLMPAPLQKGRSSNNR